ncbi:antichymotrypsin-2-like isoform X1 [Ostrinia furnacalis]|uniref:antichymotrypsin-2-like isoform X1 n=1 Tax=Ostrinia furnacalis TaxID=93504 RepID=UPI0010397816|nr:antichymotrypsin-2-like isoform X1 [Ostrinia furnacalis]
MSKYILLLCVTGFLFQITAADTSETNESVSDQSSLESDEDCYYEVPEPQCPENEQFSQCPFSTCRPQTCQEAGFPVPCPIMGPDGQCPGEPGCICVSGYLRNDEGVCIPEKQCPSCGGDKNAVRGCGVHCRNTCATYKASKKLPCPLFCNLNGCDCRQGFVFDGNLKRCVRPQDCTPTCQVNEVFESCSNVICRTQNCADKGKNIPCRGITDRRCDPKCLCRENYMRNKDGKCIPEDQCEAASNTTAQGPDSPSSTNTSTSTCTDAATQEANLERGNTIFTGKVFYQVVKNNPEKSVIVSPLSVLPPLGILALSSRGQTNQELLNALNLKSNDDVRCAFPGHLRQITATNGTELDYGAKIYVYEQGKLNQTVQNDAKNVFNASVESLDFTNPNNASDVINNWVSDVTKGKITKLTSPDMFDAMTRLVIADAIYFKGLWKYEFNINNTKPRDFHVNSNKTIQVPTMQQKGKFQYAELSDLNVQVVELPYKDEDITFLVVLPRETDGLLSVAEKLQDPTVIDKIYGSLSEQTVTIFLPRIPEVSTRTNLIDVLRSIGITLVFDSAKSELSGMTVPDEALYVSDAVQEATITVNEEGAEAAAANAVVIVSRNMPLPPPVEFKLIADHPFVFLIRVRNLIIFIGTFANKA